MHVACVMSDTTVPRTIFFQTFLNVLGKNRRYLNGKTNSDGAVFFHGEEISPELNWPRFGDHNSVFVRGGWVQGVHAQYTTYGDTFIGHPGRKCVINMQSGSRLARDLVDMVDVFIADINLRQTDRRINPRTVNMPALPITVGQRTFGARKHLAAFRGYRSHEVRDSLGLLHNGRDIICELSRTQDHSGKIDAMAGLIDPRYAQLMQDAVFALVPRGDANFSYRLTEAMSFGCIPVIISDNWVLPFDRIVSWSDMSLRVPESNIESVPHILRSIPEATIAYMQRKVAAAYNTYFASPDAVVETLLQELELIVPFVDLNADMPLAKAS